MTTLALMGTLLVLLVVACVRESRSRTPDWVADRGRELAGSARAPRAAAGGAETLPGSHGDVRRT